jgi:hypothetical protein
MSKPTDLVQGTLDLLMTHGASRSLIRFGRTSIYLRF